MSGSALKTTDSAQAYRPDGRRIPAALRPAGPALLFGVRLWGAVCLALFVAFWLELDIPSWACTSAAIVCQPVLGASLRKGWFRLVIGAIAAPVDADSFWIDGYFEESNIGDIQEGDPASIKLMGYSDVLRGHVASVARGINVPNTQPDHAGLTTVNPIFTWVRLAQRVPVRIYIDQVPDGVRLVQGMTASVEVHRESRRNP
jgi:Fusaric acid resistance protein family/Cation efflux system protein CusB domain 1